MIRYQVNEFSILWIGRCKPLGLWNSFLSCAPHLSEANPACLFTLRSGIWLLLTLPHLFSNHHEGWWHLLDQFWETLFTFGGQKSLMTVTFLVYWYGRRYFHIILKINFLTYIKINTFTWFQSLIRIMWYIQSSLASICVPSIYCSPFKKYSYLFNNCFKVCISHSVTSNSVTPWTVACQALLSMEFSRQEYWRGLPFSSPGVLPNPGIKPGLLHCRQIL